MSTHEDDNGDNDGLSPLLRPNDGENRNRCHCVALSRRQERPNALANDQNNNIVDHVDSRDGCNGVAMIAALGNP